MKQSKNRRRNPPDDKSRLINLTHHWQSLASRFEQQVKIHGPRVAVKTDNSTLTYESLNRAANRVAHAISYRAKDGDRPVALLFEQGPRMVAATLGALKTGMPFVQLDCRLPRDRNAQIVEDAAPGVMVTADAHVRVARSLVNDSLTIINTDRLGAKPDTNLQKIISPERLAYINYTSGSTGEPKGVVSNHMSELHSIMIKSKALSITADDRISLLRSSNVGATSDALLGLLNGAALHPRDVTAEGLASLGDWLDQERITVLTCVASVFRHAMGALDISRRLPDIRLVHVGGEPLYRSDVELFRSHFSDSCWMVNRLGISETKTATYFFINRSTAIPEPVVPVGFPLDGYEISIVDDEAKLSAPGSVGEIAVKGKYLAQGYWRRPQLTASKFFADPLGGDERVYLTGDLGYLRPDGCLVHVGRKDFQAKIRGHRVELSEVEIAILDIAGVKQAAVIVGEGIDNDARLIAYVVPNVGACFTKQGLRALLKKKLPNYMIPSSFVFMDTLPMTTSGKIDRQALRAPHYNKVEPGRQSIASHGALEAVLTRLCCEILQLPEVGIGDDFFDLGGDSLLATQIVARINQMFQLGRPLKTLFEASTVAHLAAFIVDQECQPGDAEKAAEKLLKNSFTPIDDTGSELKSV